MRTRESVFRLSNGLKTPPQRRVTTFGQNEEERWASDLVKDRDLVAISRLFPVLGVVSWGLPMLIGWAMTRTWEGALGGLIWGGLVRVFVLHHATFSVNSVCHLWGRRPFTTRVDDRATNFAPLALLAMGENWHNLHHSCLTLARHGVDRHQLDSTARLIRILQGFGVVWDVNWPDAERLDRRRRDQFRNLVKRLEEWPVSKRVVGQDRRCLQVTLWLNFEKCLQLSVTCASAGRGSASASWPTRPRRRTGGDVADQAGVVTEKSAATTKPRAV